MMQDNQDNNNLLFHLLSSTILFLFSLQFLTLGFSLFQVRISAWLARGILGVSAVNGMVSFFHYLGMPNILIYVKRLRRWQIPFLGFLGIAALIYFILWAAATIMPDLSYDGNIYHIPSISMWDVRGFIHWVNTTYLEGIINGYPKGVELVSYILVKAFSNSIINAVNLIFLPLGIFGIAYLARSLGAGRLLSICAGAAFLLIPVNINQSVTTYVDSAYASCAVGLMAMFIHLSKIKSPNWQGIILSGMAMGLVLSVKSTGIALSGLAVLALTGLWIKDVFFPSLVPEKSTGPRQLVKTTFQRLALLLTIALIALAGAGYWYFRNYLITGTPLYPVGVTILGHTLFPGVSVSEAISENSNTLTQLKNQPGVVQILYTWAQGLKAWPVSIKGYDSRNGGLGFIWLFACIPSILIAIFSFAKFTPGQKRSLLVLGVITSLVFLVTPMNWWARYTIWIYGLGLPCFALVLTNSVFNPKVRIWSKLASFAWMAFCLCFLLFEAAYSTVDVIALASPGPLRSNLMNVFKPASWKWPTCYLFPDMQDTALENVLNQTGIIVVGPHGDMKFWRYAGLVGQLSQPIGARKLIFINESQAENEQIDLTDTRYIIWDESIPVPPNLASRAGSITPAAGFLVLSLP